VLSSQQPALRTGRIRLRTIEPVDYEFIKYLELAPERLVAYRHRGTTPAPEAFAQRLWHGVLAQFLVVSESDDCPLGVVAAFSADFRNANAQLAVVAADDDVSAALVMEGIELFVSYLFSTFHFNKLYAYVLEANYARFERLLGSAMVREGVLAGHEFYGGRWVDMYILAVHRTAWDARPPTYTSRGLSEWLASDRMVGPDEFTQRLGEAVGVELPPSEASLRASLRGDLGLDSLGLLQVIEVVEGEWPGELPLAALGSMATVGDAYHFFCAIRERDDRRRRAST
jgi:acyl carrier protein